MCGIIGFNWNDKNLIKRMANSIIHRGPDDHGYYTDNHVSLGHRRLSIIDLSKKGKQPMCNEDGDIWITYNGEIYNHKEIRAVLEKKGHKFMSNTDAEVIIHSYEEFGEKCLELFNGMFAFCIYDSSRGRLFLARDRIGIKPLYYYFTGGKFIFSSEIKAILKFSDIKREININGMKDYFTYTYIPGPDTLFKNIKKLKPSKYLILDLKKKRMKIRNYWDLSFNVKDERFNIIRKKLFKNFKDSVKKRLMSDVPFGAYLSGGVDSSSIVAMMSTIIKEPIKTFSVGFDSDQVINELYYAKLVSDKFNTEHKEIIVSHKDAFKILPKIIYHLDEPIVNPAAIPLYFMSKKAKSKITVVLTGNGGDELFAGYRQHKVISKSYKFYSKANKLIDNKMSMNIIKGVNAGLLNKTRLAKYGLFLERFIPKLKNKSEAYSELMYEINFSEKEKNKLITNYNKLKYKPLNKIQYIFNNKINVLNQLISTDLRFLLPENYLMIDDKINMSNSLESRVPFLDHTLINFAGSILPKYKLNGFKGKFILKQAMKNLLPKKVITRKKYGFSPPVTYWIDKEFKNMALDIFTDNDYKINELNQKFVKRILTEKGKKHYNKIYPLLLFGLWYKEFNIE